MDEKKKPAGDPRRERFDSEIDARAIVKFGVWLVLGVVLVVVVIVLMESRFEREAERGDAPPSPLVDRTQRRLPPEPRLQPTPALDYQAYRAEEARRMTSWGWVDERQGVVHIPVERAMDILAARGLPSRAQPAGAEATPAVSTPPAPAAPHGGRP